MKNQFNFHILLVLLALWFFPQNSNAQWKRLTSLNAGDILCMTRAEGKIYAGTNGSGVYVSTDNGSNWSEINTGLPYGLAVSTIYFTDGKLYVGATTAGVTELPKIYTSSSSSYSWSLIDNKGVKVDVTKFNAMYKYKDTLYLGTDKGVFRSAASGSVSTWTNFGNGIGLAVNAQAFAHDTTNNLLYIGTGTLGVYLYKDGKAFQRNTGNPSPTLNTKIYSLVISGNKMYAGTEVGVWMTLIDATGAVAWSKLSADKTNCITIASNGIYAGTDSKGVQTLSTGGTVFAPTTDWALSKSPDKKVQCIIASGNQVLAGTALTIFKTTDLGNSWNFSISGLTNLSLPDGGSEIPVTRMNNVLYMGTNRGLFKSADEGITWQQVPIIATGATSANISLVSSNNSILYVAISSTGLFKSIDYGLTWTKCADFPDGSDKTWNCIAFYNNSIFVGGLKSVYKSTNGGDAWGSMMKGFDVDSVSSNSRCLVVYNDNLYYGGSKGMHKTNLNVIDWADITPRSTDRDYRGLAVINGKIFGGSRWYGVMVSSDDGLTYVAQNGDMESTTPYGFAAEGEYMIAKGLNPGISYLSADNGLSWRSPTAEIPGATSARWALGGGRVFGMSYNVIYLRDLEAPFANFGQSAKTIQMNNTVSYTDMSGAGQTSWKWEFPGGVPSVSYLKNPTVLYPNPGVFNATLTTSGPSGSCKVTKPKNVTVLGSQSWLPTGGIEGAFVPSNYSMKSITDIQSIYNYFADSKSTYNEIAVFGNRIVATSDIGIFISTDKGNTWTKKNKSVTTPETDLPIPAVSTLLRNDSIIVATSKGVFVSADNGASWMDKGNGLTEKDIIQLKQKGNQLYALTKSGMLFTATVSSFIWSQMPTTGLVNASATVLQVSTIYPNANGLLVGTYATNGGGIFSFNNGAWSANYVMPNNFKYISSFTEGGGKMYASVGSQTMYYEGVLVSSDGGKTWSQMSNTGIENLSVEDVAYMSNKVFASTPSGLFTTDATNPVSWTKVIVSTEFTSNDVDVLSSTGSDLFVVATGGIYSTTDGTVFTKKNGTGIGALPSRSEIFAMESKGATVFASVRNQGLFVSTDEGQTWTLKNNGLSSQNPVTTFFVDGNTVYAGTLGKIYKTVDDGNNWTSVLDASVTFDVSTTLAPASEIRCIEKFNNQLYVGTNGDGLYKLNGSTWSKMGFPFQPNDKITSLMVKDQYLFIGKYIQSGGNNQGIYRYDASVTLLKATGFYTPDIKAMTECDGVIWIAASHEALGVGGGIGNGLNNDLPGAPPYETMYYSDDNGEKWTAITENIQRAPAGNSYFPKASDVLAVSGGVYFATQSGIYFVDNNTKKAYFAHGGMPKLPYNNFWPGEVVSKFANTGNNILAGTAGFGVFKYPNYVDFSSTVAVGSYTQPGIPVTLIDKSSANATMWTWNIVPSTGITFLNTTSVNSQNPEISFTNTGVYTFTLTVSDGSFTKSVTKTNFITVKNPSTFLLTIEKSGNGTVTPDIPVSVYNSGASVTITATPITNHRVKNFWINGVKQTGNSATITMTEDKIVSVEMVEIVFYTVNIAPVTNGTATQNGTGVYYKEDVVNFNASPATTHFFASWTVNGVKYTKNPLDILLLENLNVVANFSPRIYTLKINASSKIPASDLDGGTSSPAPGIYSFNAGTSVTVSALNSQHYSFGEWRIVGSTTFSTATINMVLDGNKELDLDFNLNSYKVSMASNAPSVVSFNYLTYNREPMATVKLQAFYPTTYKFLYWVIGDVTVTNNPYTLTVEKSVTAMAFVENTSNISDKSITDYNIYPNPAKSVLNISNATDLKQVEITNISGQVIQSVNVSAQNIALNVADLRNGFYILKLVNKNGKVLQSKFLKE